MNILMIFLILLSLSYILITQYSNILIITLNLNSKYPIFAKLITYIKQYSQYYIYLEI